MVICRRLRKLYLSFKLFITVCYKTNARQSKYLYITPQFIYQDLVFWQNSIVNNAVERLHMTNAPTENWEKENWENVIIRANRYKPRFTLFYYINWYSNLTKGLKTYQIILKLSNIYVALNLIEVIPLLL